MTWNYRKAKRGEVRCEQCRYGNNTERWWSGRWSCTLHGMTAVGAKMTCQYAAQQEKNEMFTMKVCKYCASPEGKGHDDVARSPCTTG